MTRFWDTAVINMLDLAIEYREPATIRPNKHNARTHSKRQVSQIAQSITAFGFTNPILVDEASTLIAGHGRLEAAKNLNLNKIPVIEIAGLSENQKRGLLLADNKIAQNAGWDADVLRVEIGTLSTLNLDFSLDVTGFSAGEIDVLLNPKQIDPDDEVIPAAPSNSRVQTGDIWRLGDHRIGCGDCRDTDFLKRLVGADQQVAAAFLDPPYNVAINGHANVRSRHREFAMASGEMSDAQFRSFLAETLGACASVSRNGAVHFICMDWRHMDDLSAIGKKVYGELLNLCVWNKSNAGMGSLYRSKHELVFVYRVGTDAHFNAVELGRHGRNRTNVWDYASVNSMVGSRREDLLLHPTVKPVAMVSEAICDVTRRGELVLDTFLGSGTSLIAAERTGRHFAGCDIDSGYVEIAMERWSGITGREPERLY
jgi:DNA modification methylase